MESCVFACAMVIRGGGLKVKVSFHIYSLKRMSCSEKKKHFRSYVWLLQYFFTLTHEAFSLANPSSAQYRYTLVVCVVVTNTRMFYQEPDNENMVQSN